MNSKDQKEEEELIKLLDKAFKGEEKEKLSALLLIDYHRFAIECIEEGKTIEQLKEEIDKFRQLGYC